MVQITRGAYKWGSLLAAVYGNYIAQIFIYLIVTPFFFQAGAKGLQVPCLGPKEADANKREFTDEQLKEG